jgi:hypothetical protein
MGDFVEARNHGCIRHPTDKSQVLNVEIGHLLYFLLNILPVANRQWNDGSYIPADTSPTAEN